MASLSELKAQLAVLRQGWKLVPSTGEVENYRRDCEENLLLIQIEAESMRTAIKHEILLAKKVRFTKGDQDFMRTAFGWEVVREQTIQAINQREIRGIHYYETEIARTYESDPSPTLDKAVETGNPVNAR